MAVYTKPKLRWSESNRHLPQLSGVLFHLSYTGDTPFTRTSKASFRCCVLSMRYCPSFDPLLNRAEGTGVEPATDLHRRLLSKQLANHSPTLQGVALSRLDSNQRLPRSLQGTLPTELLERCVRCLGTGEPVAGFDPRISASLAPASAWGLDGLPTASVGLQASTPLRA
jgi:hypothetical protein